MLFNSYEFIFIFLSIVSICFYFVKDNENKVWLLILSSIVFYAQWDMLHLAILLSSVCFNYSASSLLSSDKYKRKYILFIIIIINLLPLVYFKYSNFLHLTNHSMILPLAISFFTFQQIAFNVDIYKGKIVRESFKKYIFFVLFFPQLVAGPIVHYNELIPQIKRKVWGKFDSSFFQAGVVLFCIGLFKKVVIADNLAPIADKAFEGVSHLSSYDAWLGVFSYSFQIYFDFSGYADMAIGLGLLFGVKLPINFNSPYKAGNLINFWRQWHITLSNFLKEHIYIPLGGNRVKVSRNITNLIVTMTLGGIWHGAGWGFLLWGFLHGVVLALLHVKKKLNINFPKHINIVTTFLVVTLLWVLFRASDINVAYEYYKVVFNLSSFHLPTSLHVKNEALIIICFFIVWFLPNSLELIGYMKERFTLKTYHAVLCAILFFIALKAMALAPAKSFVYFNF